MLESPLAQEVADTISAAIGHNVLITDASGLVIGSGDAHRVGTFHEASMPVVASGTGAEHDESRARRLRGVQPGVTLPVLLGDRVVGTVGITGRPEVVRPFGEIVRIQTEIMLRQTMLVRLSLQRERALEELFGDLASFDAGGDAEYALTTRAEELGVRLDLARVAVVVRIVTGAEGSAQPSPRAPGLRAPSRSAEYVRTVRDVFDRAQDVVADLGTHIGVLSDVGPGEDAERMQARVVASCQRLLRLLRERHEATASAGVGRIAGSLADLRQSYDDAWAALMLGGRMRPGSGVHHTDDYRVAGLLLAASSRARQRYRQLVLGPLLGRSNWPELRSTILAWCESGYRPAQTARALHVHRNTVVYRLARLEHLTGASLRDFRHTHALYLACLLEDLDEADR